MSLPYEHRLIENAKKLRKEMTKQERHLWYDFLRDYPIRFQRQKAIGSYIVDFYCHAARFAIELDGSQHYEEAAQQYDKQRTLDLEQMGLTVLRFTNLDINQRFEAVCMTIDREARMRIEKQTAPEMEAPKCPTNTTLES